MREMEEVQTKLKRDGARIAQVTREHEQFTTDIGNSLGVCIDEQRDQKEMLRNLAQQVEALRSGASPGAASSENNATSASASSENSVPIAIEIEDLKQKVARLIERGDQRNREVSNIGPVMHRVDMLESQVERWRHRLPAMSLGDEIDEVTTAIDLQEEFEAFKVAD